MRFGQIPSSETCACEQTFRIHPREVASGVHRSSFTKWCCSHVLHDKPQTHLLPYFCGPDLLPTFLCAIAKVLTVLEGTDWATFIGKSRVPENYRSKTPGLGPGFPERPAQWFLQILISHQNLVESEYYMKVYFFFFTF